MWNFFRNNLFRQLILWGCWCLLTNPPPLYTKENEICSLKAREKTKNYTFFKNKCNSCKNFSGHVACSFDKPFPPVNSFLPDIPKSIDGHPRKFKKVHFFQKRFFKIVFLLKIFLWTRRMQFQKTFQFFFQKLEKCLLKKRK